jgi:hypothetical protein
VDASLYLCFMMTQFGPIGYVVLRFINVSSCASRIHLNSKHLRMPESEASMYVDIGARFQSEPYVDLIQYFKLISQTFNLSASPDVPKARYLCIYWRLVGVCERCHRVPPAHGRRAGAGASRAILRGADGGGVLALRAQLARQ